MAVQLKAFDAADYIETPEDVAMFINAALEEEDPHVLASALGAVARSRGMASVAEAAGVSRESLYRSLSESGNPTLETLMGVLSACGLRLQVAPASKPEPVGV